MSTIKEENAVIRKAIKILENEGWTQGNYYVEGEGYCILGALRKAAGFDMAQEGSAIWNWDKYPIVRPLLFEIIARINIAKGSDYMSIDLWNDSSSTTKDKVIKTLQETLKTTIRR